MSHIFFMSSVEAFPDPGPYSKSYIGFTISPFLRSPATKYVGRVHLSMFSRINLFLGLTRFLFEKATTTLESILGFPIPSQRVRKYLTTFHDFTFELLSSQSLY